MRYQYKVIQPWSNGYLHGFVFHNYWASDGGGYGSRTFENYWVSKPVQGGCGHYFHYGYTPSGDGGGYGAYYPDSSTHADNLSVTVTDEIPWILRTS